ncbi:ATP-binding protein [Dactylosporangium sp. NPDC051485]|uniref:ATP-binding protein n=1 Tax=Dactylosporangium sp. NPDC051485 TaxID=3154846 RepID=UPI003440801D
MVQQSQPRRDAYPGHPDETAGELDRLRDVRADAPDQAAAQQRAERRNRALVATIEAQRAVTAAVHDRAEVLRVVADRAVAAFPAADGAVVELLVPGDTLEYAAAAGTLLPHVGTVLPLAGSLSGLAMAAGATVRCGDTERDARVNAEACRRTGIGSMCIAPLHAAQRAIGVLKVSSRAPGAFDEADEQQLELLAASLSGALRHAEDYAHNARLLQERTDALAQLAQRNVELAAERAYLNEMLDIINVSVMTCDREGNLVHLNRAGRSVPAGPPPTRIEHLHRVAPAGQDPAPDHHPLARALRGEVIEAAPMVLHGGSGRDRALIVDARPLPDPGGRPSGAICTAFDVTALRDREAELAGFAGVVAHDLKNPLTGIIGFAEMAAELLDEAGTGRGLGTAARYVTRVKENAQHMDQLIDDLLAFATTRDAPLRPGWADLSAMVGHIVMVRSGHLPPPDRPDILAADLPTVWADPGMLRQVLDNLIGNAVKYTRPGSRAEVTVSAERGPSQVCIRVADRGIGIPADQRQKVLSQFHRAHTGQGYAGTGLGLAICQRVIDRHGGTIDIAENPGGGTLVTVTLSQP